MSRCQARCSVRIGTRYSYGALNETRRFYQCHDQAMDGQFCAYHAGLANVRVYKPANDYMPKLAA